MSVREERVAIEGDCAPDTTRSLFLGTSQGRVEKRRLVLI